MIRTTTIEKQIKQISELRGQVMDLENHIESKYGYIPTGSQIKIDKIEERAERLEEKLIARCHEDGLCSEYGFTPEEADNPYVAQIESLFIIGDGSWC